VASESLSEPEICLECIGDDDLRETLKHDSRLLTCSYCEEKRPCVSLDFLAEVADPFLRKYLEPGDSLPVSYRDDGPDWEQEGETLSNLIEGELEIDYSAAEALAEILIAQDPAWPHGEEPFFTSHESYVRSHVSTERYAQEWEDFSNKIKHERRFFDESARARLARILGEPESERAAELPVLEIGPKTRVPLIYRARRAETESLVRDIVDTPARELGPPPPEKARPGRMNPAGIPVFYGGCSENTAVAEVRPSVGGFVVVAAFKVLRRLRLFDLSRIDVAFTGSIFAADYEDRADRVAFLQSFHSLIARPIHPNQEPLDYIPTQGVAEYVSNVLGLDGILYGSAQVGAVPEPEYGYPYVNIEEMSDDELAQQNVVLLGSAGSVAGETRRVAEEQTALEIVADTVKPTVVSSVTYEHRRHYLRDNDVMRFPF
jgi:hypothetical protein